MKSGLTALGCVGLFHLTVGEVSGATVAVSDAARNIYLENGAGQLVDINGASTASNVGVGSLDVDWDPVSGALFSHNSSLLYRNDGSGWTTFSNLAAQGLITGASGRLSVFNGSKVAVTDANQRIYLLDSVGQLVDFSGSSTTSWVGGGSLDIAWDPLSGALFSHNSSTLWRNDGSGWVAFADLAGLGLSTGVLGSVSVRSDGLIALTDAAKRLFLMNSSGALVDFSGAGTTSHVGVGSIDVDWDSATGDLYSNNSSLLYRNDGSGWTVFADLTAQGMTANGVNGTVAVLGVPEPSRLLLTGLGAVWLLARHRRTIVPEKTS